ncbi:hypothetical protein BJY00DRAFT_290029 [Aspergillus carlsbadensis]|nr:hypothetical protein BJY00DRAFT_290029 [Aspergillus carlsbadensis]
MASPLNVGDIYLLGRLAFKLGNAFSKGRKSAPHEFREVENQLYSLSAALQAFRNEIRDSPTAASSESSSLSGRTGTQDENVVGRIVESCSETLKHLETVIEKYSVLGQSADRDSASSAFRRWNDNIKSGWKAVLWTKEGGDLMTLRSNLAVHTNSLNLLLGVIVNSQAQRIETKVNDNHGMLHDIHTWFKKNLEDSSVTLQRQATQSTFSEYQGVDTFELHENIGTGSRLVCPLAAINPSAAVRRTSKPPGLFVCHCVVPGSHVSHRARVESFALSPLSICTRVAGAERMFMLYKIADRTSGMLKSLFVKRLARSDVAEVEDLFQQLSLDQAKTFIHQGTSNLLCFTAASETGPARPHILNLIADTRSHNRAIESVAFNMPSQRMSYGRSDIDAVYILHYKSTDLDVFTAQDEEYPFFQYEDHAEIVLSYAPSSQSDANDLIRTTLHLMHDTRFRFGDARKALIFENINCIGYTSMDDSSPANDVEVTINFATEESCASFKQKVEDMRLELFTHTLQYPTPSEKKLWTIQASTVYTEHFQVSDAEVSILENTTMPCFRLTIASRDGLTIISQELPKTFLDNLSSGHNTDFRSPAYVVQLDETGVRRVKNYAQGFSVLGFSDVTVEHLFRLGLDSISVEDRLLSDERAV